MQPTESSILPSPADADLKGAEEARHQPGGFHCNNCGKCCSNLKDGRGVLLAVDEIPVIARQLGLKASDFLARHVDLLEMQTETLEGVAFALKAKDGRCPFLTEDQLCRIHEVKPDQCRRGPFGLFWPASARTDYDCLEELEIPASWNTEAEDRRFAGAVLHASQAEALQSLVAVLFPENA